MPANSGGLRGAYGRHVGEPACRMVTYTPDDEESRHAVGTP
ncbi:hypothetical protein ACF05T_24615 [Streptomyces lateritius]|uniref:Uncharacterized protein n=1 Tax=Streptomyces lateritius TaxID=67313 RepID=A0ABW6YHE8_9ACTN